MVVAIENLRVRNSVVLVKNMEFGQRKTSGGIFRIDDNMTVEGARPRMAEVLAVGPEVVDVKVGQFITLEHGRWTRAWEMLENNETVKVRMIDPNDILLVADESTTEYQLAEKL